MYDRREAILAQIEVVLGAMPQAPLGFLGVYRNRGVIPADKRPCAVLLDGKEVTILEYKKSSRNSIAPKLIELQPQVFILLVVRSADKASEYGPEISAYRMAVLGALFSDETLRGLVGTNGRVDGLRGVDTDMQTGSTMEGQLQINLSIQYVLHPEDLI